MAEKKLQAPTPVVYKEWQDAWEFFNEHLFKGELHPCLITLHRHPRSRGYFSENRFVNRDGETTAEIAMNPEYFAMQNPLSVLSTLAHEMAHQWQAQLGKDKSRTSYHNTEWADRMTALGLEPSSTGMPGGKRTGEKVTHYIIKGGPFEVFCNELLATGSFVSWFDRHSAADGESSHFIYDGTPIEPPVSVTANHPEAEDEADGEEGAKSAPATTAGAAATPVPANHTAPAKPATATPVAKPLGATVGTKLTTPTARKAANGGISKSNRAKYVCGSCSIAAWGKPGLRLVCGDCEQDMPAQAA